MSSRAIPSRLSVLGKQGRDEENTVLTEGPDVSIMNVVQFEAEAVRHRFLPVTVRGSNCCDVYTKNRRVQA